MNDETEPELSSDIEAMLRDDAVWMDLDDRVIDDTVDAVMREVELASTSAGTDVEAVAPVVDLEARRSGRIQGALLGAAAAAVLVLGGFIVANAVDSGSDDADVVLSLAPTDREPGASGSVELTDRPDGTRVVIDTDGLPPAPDGFYYEAWLRTGPDFGVSAGTFHLRGGGGTEIELWAGVSIDDFPLFTVTLQPEGMEESSGQVVLSGRFEP